MASLMENLITVLEEETEEYSRLLELSMKKTPVIVAGNLESLQQITDEEQEIAARLNRLENKREEVTKDIANVLNRDVQTLKLANIVDMLESRPVEQKRLAKTHDALKMVLGQMTRVNEQNRELLQQSAFWAVCPGGGVQRDCRWHLLCAGVRVWDVLEAFLLRG